MFACNSRGLRRMLCGMLLVLVVPCLAGAEILPLGSAVNGVLSPTATAEYTLTIPTPGTVTITLDSWLSTYNWGMDIDRLYLYNSEGDPVGWGQFGSEEDPYLFHMMQGSETLPINLGLAGTYTLKLHSGDIYNWEGATMQSYAITATLTEAADTHENNGTMETATDLALDTQITAHQWNPVATNSVDDDEDYYRISVPGPGILTISLDGWINTLNWSANYDRMFLYTSEGVMFNSAGAEEYYAWMMGDEYVGTVNLSAGGTYYIRLHAGNGASTEPYTLQVGFQAVPDAYEPNDTVETATPIESGAVTTAYQWYSLEQGPIVSGDEDWYTFTMAQDDTVTITLNDWVPVISWTTDYDIMYLYRLTGGDPVEVTKWEMLYVSAGPFVRQYALDAGNYAIRLHSGNGVSTDPYTIQVDYQSDVAVADETPTSFDLQAAYPNPFNPRTTLSFTLPEASPVRLAVYSVSGQKVATLVDEYLAAGSHSAIFDGSGLASGVYFYRCEAAGAVKRGRMVLVK